MRSRGPRNEVAPDQGDVAVACKLVELIDEMRADVVTGAIVLRVKRDRIVEQLYVVAAGIVFVRNPENEG